MNTDERLGTFEGILEAFPEPIRDIARVARALVLDLDPDAFEVPRLGDNAASYGVGESKMKQGYCYVMPMKEHVNLGFFQGASLADPSGLLEGTGKAMRHVKVRDASLLASPALRALVAQAIAERAPYRS